MSWIFVLCTCLLACVLLAVFCCFSSSDLESTQLPFRIIAQQKQHAFGEMLFLFFYCLSWPRNSVCEEWQQGNVMTKEILSVLCRFLMKFRQQMKESMSPLQTKDEDEGDRFCRSVRLALGSLVCTKFHCLYSLKFGCKNKIGQMVWPLLVTLMDRSGIPLEKSIAYKGQYSDITNRLVSQERLSPRAGTSVFIVYNHAIWWVVVLNSQLVCHTTLLPW